MVPKKMMTYSLLVAGTLVAGISQLCAGFDCEKWVAQEEQRIADNVKKDNAENEKVFARVNRLVRDPSGKKIVREIQLYKIQTMCENVVKYYSQIRAGFDDEWREDTSCINDVSDVCALFHKAHESNSFETMVENNDFGLRLKTGIATIVARKFPTEE